MISGASAHHILFNPYTGSSALVSCSINNTNQPIMFICHIEIYGWLVACINMIQTFVRVSLPETLFIYSSLCPLDFFWEDGIPFRRHVRGIGAGRRSITTLSLCFVNNKRGISKKKRRNNIETEKTCLLLIQRD